MEEEIHRHRSVCFLDHFLPTPHQLSGYAVSPCQLVTWLIELKEVASLPFPLAQQASNVYLCIVSIVRFEEVNVLELLAEGCMLYSREGCLPFRSQPFSFSLCETLNEIMATLAVFCERFRRATRCHAGYVWINLSANEWEARS
jgi:hypothetical protein